MQTYKTTKGETWDYTAWRFGDTRKCLVAERNDRYEVVGEHELRAELLALRADRDSKVALYEATLKLLEKAESDGDRLREALEEAARSLRNAWESLSAVCEDPDSGKDRIKARDKAGAAYTAALAAASGKEPRS